MSIDITYLGAETKARIMSDIFKNGLAGDHPMAVGGPVYHAILQDHDGQEVMVDFLKLYLDDPELQAQVECFDHHIRIDNQLKRFKPKLNRPGIIVYTDGGTFMSASGTIKANVAVVDFDIEGGSEDQLLNLSNGSTIYTKLFKAEPFDDMDKEIIAKAFAAEQSIEADQWDA